MNRSISISTLVVFLVISLPVLSAEDGQVAVTLEAGDYILKRTCSGYSVKMDGFVSLMDPGRPELPVRRYVFMLPPGTRATSVEVLCSTLSTLEGEYYIDPCTGILPAPGCPDNETFLTRLIEERNRNHTDTYESGVTYPDRTAWLSAAGTLGKYSYAAVSFAPMYWHPSTGELSLSDDVLVAIRYTNADPGSLEEEQLQKLMEDTSRDDVASELFLNYHEFSGLYAGTGSRNPQTDEIWDYVIITTESLTGAINSSGFIDWKEDLGFKVNTVLVSDPEITSQPGNDLAAKIRNFLRSMYIEWGIEYVLFVGDYADVPMRICYPDSAYHVYNPSDPGLIAPGTPTDCYYSDLSYTDSESWDLDGDGYLGEYNQDMPDFMPEISVGRIPVNIPSRIAFALSKSVAFEEDNGAWKSNILHAGTILFFENQNYGGYPFIDGATLLDSMETGLMNGWNITHMSEQTGIYTSPFPWPPVTEAVFTGAWNSGQYALVNWSGHGWPNGVSRTVWMWDDGDGVPESGNGELQGMPLINLNSSLEDDYPSVVFAMSCDVGFPEPNPFGNLGVDMVTRPGWGPSVGMLSASRPAAISGDWKESPGGTEQICFDFNRYIVAENYSTGDALAWGRYDAHSVYGWELVYEYMNLYNINLYGDPSLWLAGYSTGIESENVQGIYQTLSLLPGQPNPFNSSCSIGYTIRCAGEVELVVYDIHGRKVESLISDDLLPGSYSVVWEAVNIPGGVYFVRLTSEGLQATEKLLLIR